MHFIASFEYSVFLELALTELEKNGIAKENIQAFPLDKRLEHGKLFDTIHQSDGVSLFDLAAILGMIFMLLGCIYGYILPFGPVIWAFIGLIFGALLGFAIKYIRYKKKSADKINQKKEQASEVILIIKVDQDNTKTIEKILWNHFALGICKVNN